MRIVRYMLGHSGNQLIGHHVPAGTSGTRLRYDYYEKDAPTYHLPYSVRPSPLPSTTDLRFRGEHSVDKRVGVFSANSTGPTYERARRFGVEPRNAIIACLSDSVTTLVVTVASLVDEQDPPPSVLVSITGEHGDTGQKHALTQDEDSN